jgi:formylmethanofuran dehydrogenase subunit B
MADVSRLSAFQNEGRASATLGEVKNRADVVVFWGCDPVTTHPRHWDRYSVTPKGRFVPEGRAGRTVIVIDEKRTPTAELADVVVLRQPDRDGPLLNVIKAKLRGWETTPDQVRTQTGITPDVVEDLVARLRSARYGALFFQSSGTDASLAWEEASRVVRILNRETRFVMLGLGSAGNVAGAEAALTWQGGFARGIDYRSGSPRALDEFRSFDSLVHSGEVDLLLEIRGTRISARALEQPGASASIPCIQIGPGATRPAARPVPAVAIATAATSLEAGGTVTRVDGVVIRLRPPLTSRLPDDLEIVREILKRIGRRPA